MSDSRRKFLQKIGLTGSLLGLNYSSPLDAFSSTPIMPRKDIVTTSDQSIVTTTYGKVRGYTRNGIQTFKGIPYGAPTGGKSRFMLPNKPETWKGIKNALVYGPVSPQKPNTGWSMHEYAFLYQWKDGFQSEDCLRLNVWTPATQDGKKRPVMFWIHGGGFFSGSSQEHPSYDGENVSSMGDVVVVSINHRLNVFGYLDLSSIGSAYAQSGNVGMLDIVAALGWVRDNISEFGGDKDNVTIYGQSGGATKVITLMAMPAAKGLFHKAISQSNSIVQVSTKEYAAKQAEHFLADLGLTGATISKIHDLPFQRLIEAGNVAERKMGSAVPKDVGRAGWQPVVDGTVLPTHPFNPDAPSISSHIPFLVGSTRNEASASIENPAAENLDEDGLRKRLLERFGQKSDFVYQALRKSHPQAKPVEILSYVSAQNPMAFLKAERKAAQNGAPVFLYLFAWKTPVLDARPRSFHCSEIPFVFANTDECDTMTGGGEDARKLGEKMTLAWVNFARYGDPNHKGLPSWPSFKSQPGATMIFDSDCRVKVDPDKESRKILENYFLKKEI